MLSVASNFSGVGIRWIPAFIENVPIPKVSNKVEKEISNLVDKIIENKRKNISSGELEKQIDSLVYELYGLSEEERNIVENAN